MRTLRILILLVLVGFIAIGFYRGWFGFFTTSSDEKVNIGVTLDPAKMKEDKEKAADKVKELGDKLKEKSGHAPEKSESPER
jgi:multidrug efflux pump subunit AcrB